MAMIEEFFFDDRDELIEALTTRCETQLMRSISDGGAASLFVSGGSTPAPLYQALSNREIDWSSVAVGLVDDRWVDADHEASNERLVREHLLCNKAKAAAFYPMKVKDCSAKEAAKSINEVYQSQLNWPGDVVILGMGPDGHTASLFPRAEGLEWGLNPDNPDVCCAIEAIPSAVTGAYTERLSLTLSALRNTKELVLLITGAEKLAVYQSAKEGQESVADCPITALLTDSDVTVSVYWAP
jgi:6-phosphogluconolactonase